MGKGAETRERIVGRAMALASRDGFGGLSIGGLATDMRLSKSGLFAHFGSKEDLQLSVLQQAITEFTDRVIRPALALPRGQERLRRMIDGWLVWAQDSRFVGGCVIMAASHEFDDQPGPQRDLVEKMQRDWINVLSRCGQSAIEVGDFRPDVDSQQLAHDLYAMVVGYHQVTRLFREPQSRARMNVALDRLFAAAHR